MASIPLCFLNLIAFSLPSETCWISTWVQGRCAARRAARINFGWTEEEWIIGRYWRGFDRVYWVDNISTVIHVVKPSWPVTDSNHLVRSNNEKMAPLPIVLAPIMP
jgi:hypothetical protein